MSASICHHLKQDGVYCGSPALKDRNYCFFHLNLHARQRNASQARRRGTAQPLFLPFPEDMYAVQVGLAEVMWAVAENRVDPNRAWSLLSALQQASHNLLRTPNWQGQCQPLTENRPLRALADPGLEHRHGLPPDADLDDEPGYIPLAVPGAKASPPAESSPEPPLPPKKAPSPAPPPEFVPLPEDARAALHMTPLDEFEFFLHLMKYDKFTDAQEHEMRIKWLRRRRAEEAADPALAEERRLANLDWVAQQKANADPDDDDGETEVA